ncbi:MAG: CRISPR-associated protein, Csm1 family [uncultured Sulfurovum sp.]|uniref:CRISPR system single-strand-specific deoxyribonuclease Cas10/Csm1 (subtype III-A) n=1 Tax=uncultured Sulfurovum sp. TaxID=269237 RepID=A0A6S6UBK6_9BACT|nr:MAG: CRISPR-associated protein, Csm1 family [uncultured Sulfurovum sp.]
MQIAHIFNELKPKDKKSFIDTQLFEIDYFKSYKFSDYTDNALDNDFSKKYYHALNPIEDKSIISKYDDEKLKRLVSTLADDLLLISGDFWGIQKFIFDGVTTSKASKILRSRSAMVQLITYAVVDRVKKAFEGSEALLFGAGKFMILAKNENIHKIKEIQKELDSYFLKNFFGQNGFILSSSTTTKEKLLDQKNMEEDLLALGADNDDKKLNKFDLLNIEDDTIINNIFNEAQKDDAICEFCSKRVKTHKVDDTKACGVCFNEIELGKQLSKKPYVSIFFSDKLESKDNILIITLGNQNYYAKFEAQVTVKGDSFDIGSEPYFDYPKWSLKSHVPTDSNKEIKDFSTLSEGSSGLMALKADIDKLGDTFRELYKEDFKKFNRLSREVEFFFSDYITSLVAKRENVYTVFAGGDDLFLIGEYKEIVVLAKEIRDEFYSFALEKTTISMGLVMFKPTTPITFVSKMADEAEKRAKAITVDGKDRNGIDIFGVSMKYDEFIEIEESFKRVTEFLEKESDDKTALYYRLIELCDMKENINQDIRNAMWKSKLNYLFRRNVKREDNNSEIFTLLSNLIEKGEKFKPSIFLKIYNNRDKKKEK